ncbi:hypothetical protein POM88_051370 [Heracleum sosnowskyi]|uniref:Uncharacterized protein n=1 Tax=Heracleum sosnowskyi TaxID=360622 RepID=A0AAD8M3C2_9APIA|nr:hypothetical protein POM88_051370 [Heracleum sosnowskyi]
MSLFIDLVETFDFHTLTGYTYPKKIDGLLKRFPKYEKNDNYRTVLPNKLPKTSDDYISMKFCTVGRLPIYGIYSRRDLNLVAVCVEGNVMYAFDDCDLHPSFVPDLKFRKVYLGIQYTPLATRETLNYTKECMCSAISTLSLGYTPEKKNEWCDAIVLLTGITSEAVRFPDMIFHIQIGLHSTTNGANFEFHNEYISLRKRWNKISMAIRRGEFPFIFSYYTSDDMFITGSIGGEILARSRVSLINDKDKTKAEKSRGRNDQWNGQMDNSTRKREEECKRSWIIMKQRRAQQRRVQERLAQNISHKYCEKIHGFWYGSVGSFTYETASMQSLPRPTQMVRASRYFISTILNRPKVVLQVQTSRASVLLAMKNIWNKGTSLILNSQRCNLDASGLYFWFRRPRPYPLNLDRFFAASRAMNRTVAGCMCTAAAFYLCTKRDKASTSMKDVCFDHLGISEKKLDFMKVQWNQEHRPYLQLGCGRISGALGPKCVYPLQVIKRRMHVQHPNANAGCSGWSRASERTVQHKLLKIFYR